ncbi:hypothetical protein [Streptomyces camponoticapitis]|uniref:hypothetical protein n=1 Tax=Streptomyces camponoticapitis TaxID=1616125 RepID=UPI00166932E5|nr:hypothetical protein [Streptomyces camponoticapitis]
MGGEDQDLLVQAGGVDDLFEQRGDLVTLQGRGAALHITRLGEDWVCSLSMDLPWSGGCAGLGDAEVNRGSLGSALGFLAFGAEEGEGEVNAFDLTDPAFGLSPRSSAEQVLFQLDEAGQHLGVDVEHRAADASVFVLAGCPVGAPAGPELDLPAVEVLLELAPLLRGRVAVLAGWSDLAAVMQMSLVVTTTTAAALPPAQYAREHSAEAGFG